MKPARILIVEDKTVIAEDLALSLENAGYSIAGKAASGEEALLLIENEIPDIVLMDIHLSGKLDGIQTVEKLNKKNNIPVIYLTDFHDKETIKRAKHTRPAAYLLKPYQEKDLLIAIDIAFFNASTGKEPLAQANEKITETFFPFTDRFFIKEKDISQRVDISDILWIEADGAYCTIRTKLKTHTMTMSLRAFNDKFNHPLLLRVHRSFIVNMDKVIAIKGNVLVIADAPEAEISIGETYHEEVDKRLHRL
jgi:DNA-binding LytR/AlgR family response regulator